MKTFQLLYLLISMNCAVDLTKDDCNIDIKNKTGLYGSNIESQVNHFLNFSATITEQNETIVTFKCEHDSLLVGPESVECYSNGSWSEGFPHCVEQCKEPAVVFPYTVVDTKNRTVNTTVSVNCSSKYILYGEKQIKCIHGKKWTKNGTELDTDTTPRCKRDCNIAINERVAFYKSNIQSNVNYFLNYSATITGQNEKTVTFKCEHDSLLVGPRSLKCYGNGSWSEDIPHCVEQCMDPTLAFPNTVVNIKNRTVNSTVDVKCSHPKYTFHGEKQIKCIHGQKWTKNGKELDRETKPRCKLKPQYLSWKVVLIIAGSVAAFILFLIIFLSVCIWTRMKYGKQIDDELKSDPDVLRDMFCTKVWSADREKKKLVVANDFKSLKNSACLAFNTNGRLVLEQDGSPVNDEVALMRNKDRTLMILGKNDQWKYPRWRMYNDIKQSCQFSYSPTWTARQMKLEKQRYLSSTPAKDHAKCDSWLSSMESPQWGQYGASVKCSRSNGAFQVFSNDRKKSVMILCLSLEDLCEQVLHMLGYQPNSICFEEDGTPIKTDRELFAFNGSRLMAIKTGHRWTDPRDDTSTTYHLTGRYLFNVWSEDGRKRKEVYADNLVGLHYEAARALGLQPPIEIKTLGDQQLIDDATFEIYSHEVLVATEVHQNGIYGLNISRDTMSVYSA